MATTPTHRSGSFRSLPPKSRWGAQQFRAGEARKRHLQEQRPGCERLVHWSVRVKIAFDTRDDVVDWIDPARRGCHEEQRNASISCVLLDPFWVMQSDVAYERVRRMRGGATAMLASSRDPEFIDSICSAICTWLLDWIADAVDLVGIVACRFFTNSILPLFDFS